MGKASIITVPNSDDIPLPSNARHKLVADRVIAGSSGTQAVIDEGYSVRTANTQAAQILSKPDVRQYIQHMQSRGTEQALSLQDKLIRELSDMAFFNLSDVSNVDDDGNPTIDFTNATPAHYKAVTGLKNKTRHIYDNRGNHIATEKTAEVKLADKYRGLELLGKHVGMFKEPEQRVVVDVADRLLRARGRVLPSADDIVSGTED